MSEPYVSRPEFEDSAEGYDYVAGHTGIAIGRRFFTKHGLLLVLEGHVLLVGHGDGPIPDRVIAAAPVHEVEVVAKPWISLGMGMSLRMGDTTYTVQPEVIYTGWGAARPRNIRRSRASVVAFEEVLKRVQQQTPVADTAEA